MNLSIGTILFTVALGAGCARKGDDKPNDTATAKPAEKPGLAMTSDSPACKKAMDCCVKMVEVVRASTSADDINLACSGVALAADDATCDQFKQGYAASFQSNGKELAAECQ